MRDGALAGARVEDCAQFSARFPVLALEGFDDIADAQPADLNGDGVVDGADLGLLLGAWGDAN